MYNYGRTFFNEKKAQAFAEAIRETGAEDITIWSGLDAFGQRQHTVKWNRW